MKVPAGVLWFLWLLWLTVGAVSIEPVFAQVSLGPPLLVIVATGYPAYLIAFGRTWRHTWCLPLAFAIMHTWYLIFSLGVLEASVTAPAISVVLWLVILLVCLVLPITLGSRKRPVDETSSFGGPVASWAIRITSCTFLGLTIWASIFVLMAETISASEFVQANAFRDFCLSRVSGMSRDEIEAQVAGSDPGRFLPTRGNDLEISSHGRGCVVSFEAGKATVQKLLPRSGFWWMLQGQPNARLKGAFE